jgi:hypothetical protein
MDLLSVRIGHAQGNAEKRQNRLNRLCLHAAKVTTLIFVGRLDIFLVHHDGFVANAAFAGVTNFLFYFHNEFTPFFSMLPRQCYGCLLASSFTDFSLLFDSFVSLRNTLLRTPILFRRERGIALGVDGIHTLGSLD